MEIKIIRKYKKDEYTIGKLYINDIYFCDTLEDRDRGISQNMTIEEIESKKVYGSTAIPKGKYNIIITYSPHFKCKLPLVLNVKGFSYIRIHQGNTNKDTLGCILVGNNTLKGYVTNSHNTMKRLMKILNKVDEPIYLKIE